MLCPSEVSLPVEGRCDAWWAKHRQSTSPEKAVGPALGLAAFTSFADNGLIVQSPPVVRDCPCSRFPCCGLSFLSHERAELPRRNHLVLATKSLLGCEALGLPVSQRKQFPGPEELVGRV